MITLLSHLFIKNHDDVTNPAVRRAYGQLCGIVGIALNLVLFVGKFFAGTVSGSVAITADAFNNLSDAGSSVVTLLGFRLAGKKPDPEHPFGHGRMEYVSGLIVAGLILLMGAELAKSSFEKVLHPEAVDFSALTAVILAVSVCVKLYMCLYNRRISLKIDSVAMAATAADSFSDSISTTAVLAAMLVGRFTGLMIDGWVGLVVACMILWSGVQAARDTISPLLGQPPKKEFVEEIERLVMAHEGICGVHDLVVHDYGPGRRMISLHAEVPASGDILEMHDLVDNIEQELSKTLGCQAVIHMDPILTDDAQTNELRARVAALVHGIDEQATIVKTRWNVSVCSNEPTNTVISATNPLSPGSPSDASPAITKQTLKNGITFIRPPISRTSRVWVRPYIIPINAKNKAVISPCDSICNTAPVIAVWFSIRIANSTSPQWLTEE